MFHRAIGRRTPTRGGEFGDSEVGRLLCATRMRLGKDLQQIAKVLHIRYNYLVAIEDGRYEDLPGQAYAIGFVRAYADHLKLDGDEVVRRFKEDSTGLKRKAALEFTIPTPDSGIPSGLALLSAIALGAAVYGIWYGLSGMGSRNTSLVLEVPTRLLPPPPVVATAETPRANDAASGQTTPDQTTSLDSAADAAGGMAMITGADPSAGVAGEGEDDSSGDVIEVRAKTDSWIQVRDGEAVILTRLLRKGETYTAPDRPGLTLMTANAGGIEVVLNGAVMPPLGESGAVASGIVLDAEHLKPDPKPEARP
jgi:cytoskeleton protein RodZ